VSTDRYPAPIANHYGRPMLKREGDQWCLALDNWDKMGTVAVSEDFAQAWIREFRCPDDPEGQGRWSARTGLAPSDNPHGFDDDPESHDLWSRGYYGEVETP